MAPAEMPPRSENPVDISPGVEIIPPPEGSGEIIQAPEPSDNIEAPPEVNEPEAEVVVPETPPE